MQTQAHPVEMAMVPSRTEKLDVVALYNAGLFAETEERATDLTRRFPTDVFGWSLLGTLHLRLGQSGPAVASLKKAVALSPEVPDIHNNLGLALAEAGCLDEALACYGQALALDPGSVRALTNQGAAFEAAGRPHEAAASYRQAIALSPDQARSHYNLGNALKDLGRLEEAEAAYATAVALAPDYAYAQTNRGITLRELGRPDAAMACARAALEADSTLAQALDLLAACLLDRGDDPGAALELVARSLEQGPGLEARRLYCECLRRLPPWQADAATRDMAARALAEPWTRPELLAAPACRLLEHHESLGPAVTRAVAAWPRRLSGGALFGPDGPQAWGREPLVASLLAATPVCTVPLERFLTQARAVLLTAAEQAVATPPDADALGFYASLARQCHVNEYAFAVAEEEETRATAGRDALEAALAADRDIPALLVVAVAAYFPLHSLEAAERLLARPWPGPVDALLTQQVREPAEERGYREDTPGLTAIVDAVSQRVRLQYEENPYPRWIKSAPVDEPVLFDAYLRRRFPRAAFAPFGARDGLDVLVAGCGTGQHALETARRFRGARVLAVDLSLSSLGYARRKTRELGVSGIEYAQADILGLSDLGRRFDVIESSGVLHHLADPLAGWRVLLSLLRPGGCMRLGLYSDVARRGIVRARAYLFARGYTATAESMRRCRQELLDLPADDPLRRILLNDFFSISGCRDLLFHVCEHCTTPLGLKAFLAENGLALLGFDLDAPALEAYRRRYPGDPAATDLSNWHYFEEDNPDTFIEMYQFWVQKTAGPTA
uniref:Tetratricopeptide repeat protein,methyltransferase family protein n=1 Tax=Desulfovibrio sp. U5L TaxID=596152 RepID=I2PYL6_9BACT